MLFFIQIIVFIIVIIVLFNKLNLRILVLQKQYEELKKKINELETTEYNKISAVSEKIIPDSQIKDDQSRIPDNQTNQHQQQQAQTPLTVIPKPAHSQFQKTIKTSPSSAKSNRSAPESANVFDYLFTWLITRNPIAKIGIIILFFGISYLFKYSFDHRLLSPEVRLLGALALGIILFMIGWHLRVKEQLYALILQSGAFGVLYITLFAAFKLYNLVPLLLALVCLTVICAVSVLFAVLQRAMSLAIIACIGGYLAPILLSTNPDNHIALFSYYLMISSAILVISIWQSWRVLNLIGFLFTFIISTIWGINNFRPAFYTEYQIFILANMIIYGILAVILSLRSLIKERHQKFIDVILLFGTPLAAFSLQYAITQQWEYGPAYSALGFGLFYFISSYFTLRRNRFITKSLSLCGLGLGISFATLAVALAFDLEWTTLIWLFEGTVLSWVMLNRKQLHFAWLGALIVACGLINGLYSILFLNFVVTQYILFRGFISVTLLLNACLWHHYSKQNDLSDLNIIKLSFIIFAYISWLIWIVKSILIFHGITHIIETLLLCFIFAAWLWYFIGQKLKWNLLGFFVLLLWPLLFILRIINDILFKYTDLVATPWNLVWVLAFISCYYYLNVTQKRSTQLLKNFYLSLHISLFWMTLDLVFFEAKHALNLLPTDFETIKFSILLLISSSIILIFYLLLKKRIITNTDTFRSYWLIGLAPIIIYIIYLLITGISMDGIIAHWPYLPLINPLEASVICALCMITIWLKLAINYPQFDRPNANLLNFKTSLPNSVLIPLIILSLLWTNSIIIRSLSQWLHINWSWYSLWQSKLTQATLSLIWTFIAVVLVTTGHRYLQRKTWFTGVIVQIVIVIKLMCVDSMELDGLLRAFAFIIIAILMLIIGYLAPLPPKNNIAIGSIDKK